MRIRIEEIQKNMLIDEDVYSDQGNLIVSRGFSVTNVMILKNLLRQHKIDKIKVLTLSDDVHQPSPKEKIDQEIVDFKNEFQNVVSSIEDEFSNLLSGEIEEDKLNTLVENSVNMQKSSTLNVFQMMQKIKDSDDVTFSHCYSVSISAYAIGKWLGLTEEQLKDLAFSAMLSDAGKSSVAKEILMKKGILDLSEFKQMKKHVVYSYKMIENMNIKQEIKDAIKYHHEREDGSGYPEGLKGDDIPYYAKIIAIADVYTALTSNRPHRDKYTPFEALKIMEGEFMNRLDVTILTKFLRRIAENYIGNPVLLNNGTKAEIVFMSTSQISRPVVKYIEAEEIIDLSSKENKDIEIVEFL